MVEEENLNGLTEVFNKSELRKGTEFIVKLL
jgi:hypothetical protein